MPAAAAAPARSCARPAVAPMWHTALFVALLAAGPLLGALSSAPAGEGSAGSGRIGGRYLPLLGGEVALVFVMWLGLRLSGTPLRELVGGRWASPLDVGRDVALAAAGWAGITAVEALWPGRTASGLLPGTAGERLAWCVVAGAVAVIEELVFRGYLQRQFEALSGRAGVGVLAQAVLFGLVHADQGWGAAARVGLYGLGFGALALVRRSLRPGMLCHAAVDVVSGVWRV